MEDKDYYKILGVERNAGDDELRKAYRKLSMQYHPDRQNGKSDAERKAAEEKFKEVNEAYSVLKDKDKRASYDRFGAAGPQGGGFDFSGFDPAEFFREMRGSFGFGAGGFGGFGAFGGGFGDDSSSEAADFTAPVRGEDVRLAVKVGFKDAMEGCEKEFEVTLDKPCGECGGSGVKKGTTPSACSACNGSGRHVSTTRTPFGVMQQVSVCRKCGGSGKVFEKCPACGGSGSTPEVRHVSMKVPQGVESGQNMRLAGLGRCGRNGGDNGDMYVRVAVEESSLFERRGNDVYISVPVSPAVAALGGQIDIPTPYGYRKLTIQPGTSGRIMRMAGCGVKTRHGTGDLYVDLSVEAPTGLTDEQKELFGRIGGLDSASNYPRAAKIRSAADSYYAS